MITSLSVIVLAFLASISTLKPLDKFASSEVKNMVSGFSFGFEKISTLSLITGIFNSLCSMLINDRGLPRLKRVLLYSSSITIISLTIAAFYSIFFTYNATGRQTILEELHLIFFQFLLYIPLALIPSFIFDIVVFSIIGFLRRFAPRWLIFRVLWVSTGAFIILILFAIVRELIPSLAWLALDLFSLKTTDTINGRTFSTPVQWIRPRFTSTPIVATFYIFGGAFLASTTAALISRFISKSFNFVTRGKPILNREAVNENPFSFLALASGVLVSVIYLFVE